MLGTKKRNGPIRPFTHSHDCKILAADPTTEIPWSYVGDGGWKAECVCSTEYFREPLTDDRVRCDPLDPATSRHGGACEFATVTDPAVLKLALKVRDGSGGDYWWVECGSCEYSWPVPHYAESVV